MSANYVDVRNMPYSLKYPHLGFIILMNLQQDISMHYQQAISSEKKNQYCTLINPSVCVNEVPYIQIL